jgi:hypothetical protein
MAVTIAECKISYQHDASNCQQNQCRQQNYMQLFRGTTTRDSGAPTTQLQQQLCKQLQEKAKVKQPHVARAKTAYEEDAASEPLGRTVHLCRRMHQLRKMENLH